MELLKNEGQVSLPRPSILDYKDYRKFLEAMYFHKKSLRAGFSFRKFSQVSEISSPNYLQLVIKGQRNLSVALGERVAKALSLNALEIEYFCALIDLDQAEQNEKEKKQLRLLASIKSLVTKQIPKQQVRVLQEWHHLIVRELIVLPDFEPSGDWIAQKLRGLITIKEAEESLNLLVQTGFLKVKNRSYSQVDPVIDTGDAFQEQAVLQMHRNTLTVWANLLEKTERDEREVGLINIPISSDKIPEFKKRLRGFQDEIIGWLQDESNPDQIVQLGTYLIPISNSSKKK